MAAAAAAPMLQAGVGDAATAPKAAASAASAAGPLPARVAAGPAATGSGGGVGRSIADPAGARGLTSTGRVSWPAAAGVTR
jgi:hypothetical protein